MAKIYYEQDADTNLLKDKKIAVIGYGAQGYAQAQNLRDSGLEVIIGQREGESFNRAVSDGFRPLSVREATKEADYIQLLLPDTIQPEVYKKEIEPNLLKGKILGFSHGFNIHFGQIIPPVFIDVVMIAPKGPGALVRKAFTEGGGGVPCLVAVHQDASGKAKELALAYGKAIGGTRAGIIETTFLEETETDLFGEQVVLCGGVSELIRASFDILVAAGYQPEVAYFECCHELKLLVDLIHTKGISGMRERISDTAKYGDVTRGRRVINEETRREMARILAQIQIGQFAKEWILENQAGRPVLNALLTADKNHLIERVGKKLREMMPFLEKQ